jgi:predicted permease
MPIPVLLKLLAIFVVVALGWLVGRFDVLGPRGDGRDPSRALSNAAYLVFLPALLFRTTARIDFHALPWRTLFVFFGPALVVLVSIYAAQRARCRARGLPVAAPSVRAITGVFGNTVQVGIPFASALFGEAGLAIHVTIVSLHSLVVLSAVTTLVELDLARAKAGGGPVHLAGTLLGLARNTIVHPVILPVLGGLAWNALGLPWPALLDEVLLTLGQAVVPICLLLLGISLAYHGLRGALGAAAMLSAVKLVVLPLAVFVVGRFGFELAGMPLAVVTMCAALPIGSNALIFSQRYGALEGETAAASMLSTLAFVATAALWLAVLSM